VISPSQDLYLHRTGQHKHKDKHPCLERYITKPFFLPRFCNTTFLCLFQVRVKIRKASWLLHLVTTLTDQNCMQEEIKSRLNSGNACLHSVQSLLSSSLLSRNVKVKIYKTIILSVVLYGCETWALTLREEHRLRVFENRVLGEYLYQRGMK
jgi:hypothetical protein